MKQIIMNILLSSKYMTFIYQIFISAPKSLIGLTNFFLNDKQILERHYSTFKNKSLNKSISLDLGCGFNPVNPFGCSEVFGLDLYEDVDNNIYKCNLGFDKLPFENNTFDYITAIDLIEHIPRFALKNNESLTPFIFLMNEVWRVLKKDGIFLSFTPVFPFLGSFQDPTHNNIITHSTYKYYFSNTKHSIASHYGIKSSFEVVDQKIFKEHLVSILKK